VGSGTLGSQRHVQRDPSKKEGKGHARALGQEADRIEGAEEGPPKEVVIREKRGNIVLTEWGFK